MDHPPTNPNLIASDFCLFDCFKKHVAGKAFATVAVQQAVMSWLQNSATDFFYTWIQALVPLCDKV
jgi:hypothetical protein